MKTSRILDKTYIYIRPFDSMKDRNGMSVVEAFAKTTRKFVAIKIMDTRKADEMA